MKALLATITQNHKKEKKKKLTNPWRILASYSNAPDSLEISPFNPRNRNLYAVFSARSAIISLLWCPLYILMGSNTLISLACFLTTIYQHEVQLQFLLQNSVLGFKTFQFFLYTSTILTILLDENIKIVIILPPVCWHVQEERVRISGLSFKIKMMFDDIVP